MDKVEMETLPVLSGLINRPSHYHKNEIDVHGYLEKHFPKEPNVTVAEGFHIGNVVKYVSRYKEKDGLRDLEKAMDNLTVLIQLEKERRPWGFCIGRVSNSCDRTTSKIYSKWALPKISKASVFTRWIMKNSGTN